MKANYSREVRYGQLGLIGASALAMVLAAPANAQSTSAPQTTETAGAEDAIVVTGSRIQGTDAFNSPDPVTVIDPELSAKEGRFDIASTLQSSPVCRRFDADNGCHFVQLRYRWWPRSANS